MRPVVSIIGSTATGKSDLAIALARQLGGEIINADAMQFYRGMDIGTAKLPPAERGGIPHHLLDILDLSEEASVAEFQTSARSIITSLHAADTNAFLVGGSGLYVRAAIDVMNFPGTNPSVRARIEDQARHDLAALYQQLQQRDPVAAAKIAAADSRRIVRALEVMELTGRPFSASLPAYTYAMPSIQIGLYLDRAVLRARIAQRVHTMWQHGWVDEVIRLKDEGLAQAPTAGRAIGYSQILAMLAGELSEAEAKDSTITRTAQFAKRQMTWFNRDHRIHWLEASDPHKLQRALKLLDPQLGQIR